MCLTFLVKHILFVVNLLFVIIGLGIIGVGSYGLYYVNNIDILNNIDIVNNLTASEDIHTDSGGVDLLTFLFVAIIVIGAAIFLISFCGCCGSISENRCLLILYAIMMFLFAGVSIVIFIWSNNIFYQVQSLVGDSMNRTFYSAEDPVKNEMINSIQYSLRCCGPNGPLDDYYNEQNTGFIDELLDFFDNSLNITGIGFVSPSCCSTFDPHAFVDNPEEYIQDGFQCTADDVYMEGCVDMIVGYIKTAANYFKYVIGGIAGFEILAFIFAVYMCCAISSKNDKRRRNYY